MLFAGDHGTMPFDARLALCKLLSGPFIDGDSPHWPAVLRDEALLRSRLADVFLDLILDRDRRVAFTRQADTGELTAPVLLRSAPLTFIESVLLLHLREALIDAETRNERAVVDEADLLDHLELFANAGGDRVGAHKRIGAGIDKMRKNNILQSIRGTDNRYEISPALRLLFTANDVEALGKAYQQLAAGEPITGEPPEEIGE
jgi:hypothetical protein